MVHTITHQEEPSSLTSPLKFIRRPDLTADLRLKLACLMLFFRVTGGVTGLATRYQVSCTFLYEQRNHLAARKEGLFGMAVPKVLTKQDLIKQEDRLMLKLRLEGRCSLGAISSMLK